MVSLEILVLPVIPAPRDHQVSLAIEVTPVYLEKTDSPVLKDQRDNLDPLANRYNIMFTVFSKGPDFPCNDSSVFLIYF